MVLPSAPRHLTGNSLSALALTRAPTQGNSLLQSWGYAEAEALTVWPLPLPAPALAQGQSLRCGPRRDLRLLWRKLCLPLPPE